MIAPPHLRVSAATYRRRIKAAAVAPVATCPKPNPRASHISKIPDMEPLWATNPEHRDILALRGLGLTNAQVAERVCLPVAKVLDNLCRMRRIARRRRAEAMNHQEQTSSVRNHHVIQ